jgi:hypothetical protein
MAGVRAAFDYAVAKGTEFVAWEWRESISFPNWTSPVAGSCSPGGSGHVGTFEKA